MATHPNLTPYLGRDVLTSTVSIRNTGDGLSRAMEVEPVELEPFSTVYVVLECEVEKHRHEPIKDVDGALQLVNMLKAGRATIVDKDVVVKALDEQQDRIRTAEEEAAGVSRLPLDEEGEEPTPLGDAFDEAIGALEDAEAQEEDDDAEA